MKIIAHRGRVSQFTENTLEAITSALSASFDGVEFDVRRTKDDKIILMHDATVNRTTNGRGRVSTLNLEQIKAFSTADGYLVPTLDSVMKTIKSTPKIINIEIKSHGCAQQVAKYAQWPNVYISSPIRAEIDALKRIEPNGQYGLVINNPLVLLSAAKRQKYMFMTLHKALINARVMSFLRSKNQQVWVYTVKSKVDAKRLKHLGVTAVFSDIKI